MWCTAAITTGSGSLWNHRCCCCQRHFRLLPPPPLKTDRQTPSPLYDDAHPLRNCFLFEDRAHLHPKGGEGGRTPKEKGRKEEIPRLHVRSESKGPLSDRPTDRLYAKSHAEHSNVSLRESQSSLALPNCFSLVGFPPSCLWLWVLHHDTSFENSPPAE